MHSVWFGQGVADDSDVRLCGDLHGKRVVEIGLGPTPPGSPPNAVRMALGGAKAIAIDPSDERIASLRQQADRAEVRVECHVGEVYELGFLTSASIDLALATHTLDHIDDLSRLLRQVHRVLRPGAAFVIALTHPMAAMFGPDGQVHHRYGETHRSISEIYMHLERSNFRLDVIHELAPTDNADAMWPSVLVLRVRKEGV